MEVKSINICLDEFKLEESALKIISYIRPQWSLENIKFKIFTDGITNKLIGCWSTEDSVDVILIRIYGRNTNLLVDREEEKRNFNLLHEAGFAPELYATFSNGLVYAYLPGDTITTCTVREVSIYPLIAITLARIHSICLDQSHPPIIWDKTKKFLNLVPQQYSSEKIQQTYTEFFPNGTSSIIGELELLENVLNKEGKVVFCHNDLLLSNIIHDNGKVSFIDYEYAGWNYQAFDIGNHFAEFAGVNDVNYKLYPDREFQFNWLKIYLDEFNKCNNVSNNTTDLEIEQLYLLVNKFALVSHIFWAAWALVQAHHSKINFNFMGYAVTRMEEYYSKKNIFLNLSSDNSVSS